jgi:glycosyltransferase involved in cell wall biosynthesis
MISIVIPAHNEGAVIARTLKAMTDGAVPGELDLIVVCNGCADDTAAVARRFGSAVRVIETNISSKTHALNLGDEAARSFPRIYADADIVITIDGIRQLASRLESGAVLAVAPTGDYNLDDCSWLVRAVFEVRSYLPSAKEGIGGSGVYAMSEEGRRRFQLFPALTADDGYVRIQFRPEERETLSFVRSTVFPARTIKDLIATKTRAHYGTFELMSLFPDLWRNSDASNNKTLVRLLRHPRLWLNLAIYGTVTAIARRRAKRRLSGSSVAWERDRTSRVLT